MRITTKSGILSIHVTPTRSDSQYSPEREDHDKEQSFHIMEPAFKVVSNIPYGITSQVFRMLMYQHAERFQGGSIILQLEPARKLFAKEISEKHGIPMEPKVGCLSASQWEACFIEMLKMVPEKFHPVSSVGSIIDSP